MLFEKQVRVNFSDMLDEIRLPNMHRVWQKYNSQCIPDVEAETKRQMALLQENGLRGKRIAVTAGSRGIRHNSTIMRAVVESLRGFGAEPFLVAAMGSHGGATPEGQLNILHHSGIDEVSVGAPIASSMDTRKIGALGDGTPIYLSLDALDADGIFVVNKIKPHADFKACYESGLVKMMAIGLGKHKGCSTLHKLGFSAFGKALPEAAGVILQNANIIGGLAILENAYDEIMHLETIPSERILERERELLVIAKQNIAQIKVPEVDVLIVDEIGKHISGEGMDPNVTGRPGSYLRDGYDHIKVGNIVIRDVAEQSAGNGAGIGMADITTLHCVSKLDLGAMYTNSITAGILGPSRLPVILNDDREAIKTAVKIAASNRLNAPRIVRIRNTLLLEEILVSECLLEQLTARDDVEYLGPQPFVFDAQGRLLGEL